MAKIYASALVAAVGFAGAAALPTTHAASPGKHVHGEAELAIAAEGRELVVEFKSAMWNIVGFERPPETDEERAALAAARETLAGGAALIAANADAQCTLASADPGLPAEPDTHDHHDHHDDHGHDHGDHDHDAHDHHEEDDHAHHDHHDHEGHDEAGHAHRDVLATYAFDCAAPDALRAINVGFFAAFERLEKVDAVFLNETIQTAASLDRDAITFTLR